MNSNALIRKDPSTSETKGVGKTNPKTAVTILITIGKKGLQTNIYGINEKSPTLFTIDILIIEG